MRCWARTLVQADRNSVVAYVETVSGWQGQLQPTGERITSFVFPEIEGVLQVV